MLSASVSAINDKWAPTWAHMCQAAELLKQLSYNTRRRVCVPTGSRYKYTGIESWWEAALRPLKEDFCLHLFQLSVSLWQSCFQVFWGESESTLKSFETSQVESLSKKVSSHLRQLRRSWSLPEQVNRLESFKSLSKSQMIVVEHKSSVKSQVI